MPHEAWRMVRRACRSEDLRAESRRLAQAISIVKLVILVLFLRVLLYILVPSRNKTCGDCETRLICPGGGAR